MSNEYKYKNGAPAAPEGGDFIEQGTEEYQSVFIR
jgi:hypothetical protein